MRTWQHNWHLKYSSGHFQGFSLNSGGEEYVTSNFILTKCFNTWQQENWFFVLNHVSPFSAELPAWHCWPASSSAPSYCASLRISCSSETWDQPIKTKEKDEPRCRKHAGKNMFPLCFSDFQLLAVINSSKFSHLVFSLQQNSFKSGKAILWTIFLHF